MFNLQKSNVTRNRWWVKEEMDADPSGSFALQRICTYVGNPMVRFLEMIMCIKLEYKNFQVYCDEYALNWYFGSVDTGLQYWTITTIFQFSETLNFGFPLATSHNKKFLECHNLAWITERNPFFDDI